MPYHAHAGAGHCPHFLSGETYYVPWLSARRLPSADVAVLEKGCSIGRPLAAVWALSGGLVPYLSKNVLFFIEKAFSWAVTTLALESR